MSVDGQQSRSRLRTCASGEVDYLDGGGGPKPDTYDGRARPPAAIGRVMVVPTGLYAFVLLSIPQSSREVHVLPLPKAHRVHSRPEPIGTHQLDVTTYTTACTGTASREAGSTMYGERGRQLAAIRTETAGSARWPMAGVAEEQLSKTRRVNEIRQIRRACPGILLDGAEMTRPVLGL